MDLDDCSLSGYSSSSSSSLSLPSSAADVADDRMVEMELEAAEALTDLAHLAMRESGSPETATNWGNKGKRVRKRVKSESPSSYSGLDLNSLDPGTRYSDPADDQTIMDQQRDQTIMDQQQDQTIMDQQQDQTMCNDVIFKQVKAEQDAESLEPNPPCTPRYISMGGGRSRQILTEAEKEERKLRRILANRESARQTIRRRQIRCEQLTRKATELTSENQNLKMKKELAVKDYLSLETMNKHLKAQVAKAIKTEVGENPGELLSANVEISTSQPANFPLLLYNHHPLSPLGWPSIMQSSHPVHLPQGVQNAITIPSNIPNTGNHDNSQEQENHMNINPTGTPLYLVPYPWYFPLHDNGNGFHAQPSYGLKNIQDEASMHNGDGASSSTRSITHMENHHLSLPTKIRSEAFGSTEAGTTNDLNGIPAGCLPDGGGLHTGPRPIEANLTHAPLCSATSVGGEFIVKHENSLHTDYTCNTEDIVSVLPDNKQEPVNCPSKKLVDASAAAEARKRRKELTKLKNLHGRQCRMRC